MNIASVFDWFARRACSPPSKLKTHGNVRYFSNWRCYGRPPHNGAATKHRRNKLRRIRTTRSFRRRPRCMSSAEKSCSDFRLPCGGMTSGRRPRLMKGSLRATGSPLIL